MNENFEEMKNAELNEGVSISENEALNDVVEEISVEEMKNKKKKGWKSELLDWIESLGIAIIAALLIVNFVCTFVRVSVNPWSLLYKTTTACLFSDWDISLKMVI